MADRIRRQLPDVRLFTVRAHPLYLHPSHARTLNGMLVAHSTPRAREELHSTSLGMEMVHDVYHAGRSPLEEERVSRAAVQVSSLERSHVALPGARPPARSAQHDASWSDMSTYAKDATWHSRTRWPVRVGSEEERGRWQADPDQPVARTC